MAENKMPLSDDLSIQLAEMNSMEAMYAGVYLTDQTCKAHYDRLKQAMQEDEDVPDEYIAGSLDAMELLREKAIGVELAGFKLAGSVVGADFDRIRKIVDQFVKERIP